MSAKQYLNRARALRSAIRSLERRRAELNEMKTAISSPMRTDDPVQTSPKGEAPYALTVEKLAEVDELLSLRIGEYSDTLTEMAEEIQRLDPVHAEVLTRRYLDFQRFERISYEMRYTFAYTLNLHSEGLRAFEDLYPEKCFPKFPG